MQRTKCLPGLAARNLCKILLSLAHHDEELEALRARAVSGSLLARLLILFYKSGHHRLHVKHGRFRIQCPGALHRERAPFVGAQLAPKQH